MSDWIKIRIQDFYKDAIGDKEYVYVSPAVYEEMVHVFKRDNHTEYVRDLRHRTAEGYEDDKIEDLLMEESEPLEDIVIRQMDIEILQKAMQTLTEVQKERLHMYFFQGLSTWEIAYFLDGWFLPRASYSTLTNAG